MKQTFLITATLALCLALSTCKQLFQEPKLDNTYRVPESTNDGWETSSLSAEGMREAPIDSMTRLILTDYFKNIHSVVIIKNNKLVYENYFNGYDRDMLHNLYSASKSFTSAVVGLAIDKDFIPDTNERIFPHFPEYTPLPNDSPEKQSITIRHLLTMSSGLSCNDWDAGSPAAEEKLYKNKDVLKSLFGVPMAYAPDSVTQYCSGGVITLSNLISKTTGQDYGAFAKQYILDPLGIQNYKWNFREKNRTDRPDQIFLRPRDIAKFGQLYLNNGIWQGQQIISKDWIVASWKPHTKFGPVEYGFLWWLYSGTINGEKTYVYTAQGNGGQYIFVMPTLNLVVAITGGNINSPYSGQGRTLMYKFIIPSNF